MPPAPSSPKSPVGSVEMPAPPGSHVLCLRSNKPFDSSDEAIFVLLSASTKGGLGHQKVLLLNLPLKGLGKRQKRRKGKEQSAESGQPGEQMRKKKVLG